MLRLSTSSGGGGKACQKHEAIQPMLMQGSALHAMLACGLMGPLQPVEPTAVAAPRAAGVPLPQQLAVLEYRMDGTVATNDDPPAVLGRMPPAFVQQMGAKLRPGRLLRFCIGPGGVYFADGQPVGGGAGRAQALLPRCTALAVGSQAAFCNRCFQ